MHCWYDLNIDTQNVFRNDFIIPKHGGPASTAKILYFYKAHEVFNQEWLSNLKKMGVPEIVMVVLFYTPTTSTEDFAHVDWLPDNSKQVTYGINITTGKNDGDMIWYDHPQEEPTKSEDSPYNNKFSWYKLSGLTSIDRCSIDDTRWTLVNTQQPHHVVTGSVDRWCISLRFDDCTIPWQEVLAKYKHLIIPRDPIGT